MRPKSQTAYVNMTKMLIIWMIFGSRLLSLFSVSAVYSLLKYLRYTTNREANKNYKSGLGFDRLGATSFPILCEIATFVWVAAHTMGTTGFNV